MAEAPLRRSAGQPHRWAALILAAFLALGAAYAVVNPVLESPDEIFHYPYIVHLIEERALPVQRPGVHTLLGQEASQPPLYYALMAALSAWIDQSDLDQVRYLNPHARIGLPLAQDNKNIVVHPQPERFPWRGAVLGVRWVRLWSLLLGAGTVWCAYCLGRRLFPAQPEIALGAMALIAFNPQFLFISASVNNDNLVTLLSSLALLGMVRLVQEGSTWRQRALLGGCIGLACLSKLSGLALLPLAALALALRQTHEVAVEGAPLLLRRRLGRWALELAPLLLVSVGVAGWWYLRNLRLYGDPTGLNAMLDHFGRREATPTLAQLLGEFEGLRISFWGLFGVVNVLLRPVRVYWALDALSLLAALGLLRAALLPWLRDAWRGRWRAMSPLWPAMALLVAWIGAVLLALIRWTSMTKATQGRLLYPALTAITLLAAWGLASWLPARWRARGLGGVAGALALLALSAPFTSIAPVYARPPILTAEEIPAGARPFNTTYGGLVRLLAYEVDRGTVSPGGSLTVTLYWQALAPMAEDYSLYLHLFGWEGQRLGQRDSHLGMGAYPTSAWQAGQVVRDRYRIPVRRDAQGPVAAELEVGVYRLSDMSRLTPTDGEGRVSERPVLARVKVAVPTVRATPAQALRAELGGRAALAGYDLPTPRVAPGGSLPLTLYWEVLAPLERDYTVFIHLVDAQGALAGQGDGPPLGGAYPTTLWAAGEWLRDAHAVAVRPDASPGRATLWVGLYDPVTGQRLAGPGGDAARLAEVEITP